MYKKLDKVDIDWIECNLEMICPYCGQRLALDSQHDPRTCTECNHTFTVVPEIFEITDKHKKEHKK